MPFLLDFELPLKGYMATCCSGMILTDFEVVLRILMFTEIFFKISS